MSKYFISINQLAEFSVGSESKKKRILNQQINPNKLLIPWYQKAKAAIKKYLLDTTSYLPIDEAIKELQNRVPINDRQKTDQKVSIEALQLIKNIKLPDELTNIQYSVATIPSKILGINNVLITVAPDLVIKGLLNEKIVYGGIKIHIYKGKPFDFTQSKLVASLLYRFLKKTFTRKDVEVLPELCMSIDVFSERVVQANTTTIVKSSEIKQLCDEIKELWPK